MWLFRWRLDPTCPTLFDALQHQKVANSRKDFHHKVTTRLIRENQAITVESLHIQELPEVADSLSHLIQLQRQQIEVTQQAALAARTGSIQQLTAIEGITSALKEQQSAQKKADDEASANRKKAGTELDDLGKQVRSGFVFVYSKAAFVYSKDLFV